MGGKRLVRAERTVLRNPVAYSVVTAGAVMRENLGLEIRPIGLDNFSELRRIHTLAYRSSLGSDLSEEQIDRLVEFINTAEYTQLVLQTECVGTWLDGRLCATASWMPGGSAGASAKIVGVCVDPLFGGMGMGRRLVGEIEARARRAGFAVLTARCPVTTAPFFELMGFAGTSRGVWSIPFGVTISVLHMRKGAALTAIQGGDAPAPVLRGSRQIDAKRLH